MSTFEYPPSEEADVTGHLRFMSWADTPAWERFVAHAETRAFVAGEELVRAGGHDDAFFVLIEGSVEATIATPAGERTLDRLEAGTTFGEMAFFDGIERSASIRALVAGKAYRITRRSFAELSSSDGPLAQRVLFDLGKILAHRLRAMNRVLAAAR